jgi:hypothetical protein
MTMPARTVLLVALLALPLLLQGASLPHTHFGAPDGLFNQEHDLTLLAIAGTVASLDASAPAVTLVLVVTAMAVAARRRPVSARARTADSRAPPVR